MATTLNDLIEPGPAQLVATGFAFTEGPVWHPDGYLLFVDMRANRIHSIVPGETARVVRENTAGANGLTLDLQGRIVACEGALRRVVRYEPDGSITVLADSWEDKRLNRPNDVICRSDGSLYFTDPIYRVPVAERELSSSAVYRIAPDGSLSLIIDCEYPNGLAFSPDERTLYVANTRWDQYIHAIELDDAGKMRRRRIFADLSADIPSGPPDTLELGMPDGMKVDSLGNVYCTGFGGTWVLSPDGEKIGVIETPEMPANLAFGGPDLRTLFFTARTSLYSLRTRVAGLPRP